MKLFYSPGACSLSPHIVLREAGLSFDLEKVDLKAKKTVSGEDYRTINPKGYVPSLRLDSDAVLTEGPAIVQYLADLAPQKNLAPPAGSFERVQLQEWLNFISTELHKSIGTLFKPNLPEAWREAVLQMVDGRLDYLAAQMEGKRYLLGEQFSVADAYLFTVLNWTGFHKIDLSRWPVLVAYQDRIASRPAVREALRAEGLVKD